LVINHIFIVQAQFFSCLIRLYAVALVTKAFFPLVPAIASSGRFAMLGKNSFCHLGAAASIRGMEIIFLITLYPEFID
jgi:hypothetical protein